MTAQADVAVIRHALDLLFEPGDVVELRLVKSRKHTSSGYYDNFDALAQAAARYSGRVPTVYVTLNRIDPPAPGPVGQPDHGVPGIQHQR